mmetsp:Transcript_124769/g.216360  ORF Transcript_124769/g.216360 Transcript_124769/m.216360 type:complete len:207 (-) Transcript_124769:18-638(-)
MMLPSLAFDPGAAPADLGRAFGGTGISSTQSSASETAFTSEFLAEGIDSAVPRGENIGVAGSLQFCFMELGPLGDIPGDSGEACSVCSGAGRRGFGGGAGGVQAGLEGPLSTLLGLARSCSISRCKSATIRSCSLASCLFTSACCTKRSSNVGFGSSEKSSTSSCTGLASDWVMGLNERYRRAAPLSGAARRISPRLAILRGASSL